MSSFFYARTYLRIAHQVDDDLISYLGGRLPGAWVADCGCGPGVVAEKLLQHGAARVLAIDRNPRMLAQVRARLPDRLADGSLEVIAGSFDGPFFSELTARSADRRLLDVVLFKRSLYGPRRETSETLRCAMGAVRPGGVVVVIHPERSLLRYALGDGERVTSFTAFHLFNRFISRIGEFLGAGPYTLYGRSELIDLMRTAADGQSVETVPTSQRAYNLVAITRASPSPD